MYFIVNIIFNKKLLEIKFKINISFQLYFFFEFMAKRLSFKNFIENMDFYIQEALNNKIFVYPTDTVYGIWAIQTPENIIKIAKIKQRDPKQLMSVIVPDFNHIIENWELKIENLSQFQNKTDEEVIRFLKIFFDKYHWVTYIFDYKISWTRIIKHDFQKFVEKLNKQFISTSLNISWTEVIRDLKNMPKEIKSQVDYIIDDGTLSWKPSVLIDFVADKVIER